MAVEQIEGFRRRAGELRARTSKRVRVFLRDWRRAHAGRGARQASGMVYGLAIGLVALLAVFAVSLAYLGSSVDGRELRLDELDALASDRRVAEATFRDEDAEIVGRYVADPIALPVPTAGPGSTPAPSASAPAATPSPASSAKPGASTPAATPAPTGAPTEQAAPVGSGRFKVQYPKSDALTGALQQALLAGGAQVSIDEQSNKSRVRLVVTFLLPLLILAAAFTLLFSLSRGGGGGIGEVMTFGTIGGKGGKRGQAAPVGFADIAGADEAVAELKEVRDYLADPERYQEIGAQPPKGVLLFGPPGCGKTLLAKAVAGEAGVPFFSVAGAEFVESLVGVGAARVRDLFRRVRAVAPAIVFIDELDAAGRKRGSGGGGGGSDEREQTLNQLLVEMDGFDVSSGIVVMAATNRPDIIDPALMRPGRFDRHVTLDHPDVHGRREILELHARGKPLGPGVDLGYVARRTAGFTGADLANVINEAALLTVRDGRGEIDLPELEEAVQRVLAGPKRKGRMLSPAERKRIAYHESGHCIVAAASGHYEEVHRVSIHARARAVGGTTLSGDADAAVLTQSQLRVQLSVCMAGIAAEELVFSEPSTGAENDLEKATRIARDMIERYGMSERIGRARLLAPASDGFLGDVPPLGPISGMTHQTIDAEIKDVLAAAERSATDTLIRHRDVLDTLAEQLEAQETIEGADLDALLSLVQPDLAVFAEPTPSSRNGRGRSQKLVTP